MPKPKKTEDVKPDELDTKIAEQEAVEDEASDGRTVPAPVLDTSTVAPQGTPVATVLGTKVHPSLATADQMKQQGGIVQNATAGSPASAPAASKMAEEKVIFHMNTIDTPTRVFSIEDHGEGFREIADEFAATHAGKITSREDI